MWEHLLTCHTAHAATNFEYCTCRPYSTDAANPIVEVDKVLEIKLMVNTSRT